MAPSPVTLEAIQKLIEAGNDRVITALEKKFAQLERRVEILESENFEKDATVAKLSRELETERMLSRELAERIESMDANRRLSSLILTCSDFGKRLVGENIIEKSMDVLNKRFGGLELSADEIQVAHRLENEQKVIVKFLRRHVRDNVHERRFELFPRRSAEDGRNGSHGDRIAPLYI